MVIFAVVIFPYVNSHVKFKCPFNTSHAFFYHYWPCGNARDIMKL